ncbi:hypothetical protein E2C01_013265 [Portunus trituberculatus]|uniref:Uncharacterized protein n=1 Tax=Portunus trituberculatus TaxID=210409 RepID=A0A5B7DGV7_PORTR|nr:hypothetical protein [Portunus trituberculatus]
MYSHILNKLHRGHIANIPYKTIKSQSNNPKWMTNRLKRSIGQKRDIYKRLKAGDEVLNALYN